MRAATVVQQVCNLAGLVLSFIARFFLPVIAPLAVLNALLPVIAVGDGGCPPLKSAKIFFGKLSCKILALFGQISRKSREFC